MNVAADGAGRVVPTLEFLQHHLAEMGQALFRTTFGASERLKPSYGSFELAALNELVAQLVEQRPFKAWVLGSNPSELTTPSRPRFPAPANI